jgi:hypothetical protein
VLALARLVHRWGVAEIAFGGGEPLLFDGLGDLLSQIWEETSIGVGFTTNGTLLTSALLEQLRGRCGPIRVSVHPGLDWRAPVALLRRAGHPFGVNLLVTPALLEHLEQQVEQLEQAGVRNILLLRHHGSCQARDLSLLELRDFDHRLARLHDGLGRRISFFIDRCWGAALRLTPRIFGSQDCGAGVDSLSLDADGGVAACSFQEARTTGDLAELPRLHRRLARERPAAPDPGCGRRVHAREEETRPAPGVYVWRAHACNNSAPSVLVARFARRELAGAAARELSEWLKIGEETLFLDRPAETLPEVSDESIDVAARHEQAWDDAMPGGYPDNPIELALDGETLMLFNDYCLGFHDGIAAYLTERGGEVRRPGAAVPPWISVRLRLPDGRREEADRLHRFLHDAVEYENRRSWQRGPLAPWQETLDAASEVPSLRVGGHHRDGQVFLFNVGVDLAQLRSIRAWLGELGADHQLSLSDDAERHRIRALGAAACASCGASPMKLLVARWTEGIDEDQLACPGCGAMFDMDVLLLEPEPGGDV